MAASCHEERCLAKLLDLIRRHQDDAPLILLFAAGIVGAYTQATLPARHGGEMWNLAWNLADHGTFANPFSPLKTGPTASNPPLAPLLTSALIRIFRAPFLIYMSSALLSILANAFSAALLPRLSRVFFGDAVPGIFAACLWLPTMQVIPGWDTNYTSAALIYFACLTASILGSGADSKWGASVGAGVLAAALCLLNPSTLLVWFPWLVYLYVRFGIRSRRAVQSIAIILSIAFIASAGWAHRNQRALGSFVIRTRLGSVLYVSNNDCAQPTILQEEMSGCFHSFDPNASIAEAEKLQQLGEIRYDKLRESNAMEWIRTHPGRFAKLAWARFVFFWFPKADSIPSVFSFGENFGDRDYMEQWQNRERRVAYAISASTLLSCLGLALMLHARLPVVWFVIVSLGLYPLMYYVIIADVRYRDPVLWISLLPAGYFLTRLFDRGNPSSLRNAAAPQS